MLDVAGTTLSDADIRRIDHPNTGGIILFARHYQDRAQLVALTNAIREVREDILIAEIDPMLLEDQRRNWPFLRDRRIDAYGSILQRFIDPPLSSKVDVK